MLEYRPILFVTGILLALLSMAMLIPAVVDLLAENKNWISFFLSAFLSAFVGISMILTNKGEQFNLSLKQAIILTTFSWVSIAAFGALPFLFSKLKISYTDAFFEAMSGITTTGATILVGLDYMPPGIILWRSILAGIGGIGIIIFAMAILPMLRIGGMQLFKTESADKTDKIMPRIKHVSLAIIMAYCGLIFFCFASLWGAGMSGFDAINHALATIATTGFSTHDYGFAFYDSAKIEYITTFFMIAGSLPFLLYVQMMQGDGISFLKDEQVKWYFKILTASILIVALWLYFSKNLDFSLALRYGAFNVTSVTTTTGFAGTDYSKWGGFIDTFMFMLAVVGGCVGGTTGGIKIFRFQILYQTVKVQMAQLIQPHAVVRMRYNGKAIQEGVTSSVMSFIILYGFSFIAVATVLSLTGLDFTTSMSASAACLSNIGRGLGNVIGQSGNYASFSDTAKWVLAFGMLVGRLEIFTVLVLFTQKFWKD